MVTALIRFWFLLFKTIGSPQEKPITAAQKLFKGNSDNHRFLVFFEQKWRKPVNHELENALYA